MQTFKTKAFARFADREGLEDAALCLADEYPSLDAAGIEAARATGAIIELTCDDRAIRK